MKYIRLKSLTWWAGMASVALGITMIYCQSCNVQLDQIGIVWAALLGSDDPSPAAFILGGLGLIGLRDKLERLDA